MELVINSVVPIILVIVMAEVKALTLHMTSHIRCSGQETTMSGYDCADMKGQSIGCYFDPYSEQWASCQWLCDNTPFTNPRSGKCRDYCADYYKKRCEDFTPTRATSTITTTTQEYETPQHSTHSTDRTAMPFRDERTTVAALDQPVRMSTVVWVIAPFTVLGAISFVVYGYYRQSM